MACKEHPEMVQKIDKNVTYTKLGTATLVISVGIAGAIMGFLNADIKVNSSNITNNSVAISKQAGKFEIIIKQLDRIEGKLNGNN